MSGSEDNEQPGRLRHKAPIWMATALIIILLAWLVLETIGYVNWVYIQTPLSPSDFGLIASALGTIVLTFGLLLLYDKQAYIQGIQTRIQENQEALMEQQFQPYLTGEVDFMNIASVHFSIQNSGNGPAFSVVAEWNVAGQSRSWEIPRLAAGDDHRFPIIVDGDDWLLTTNEIEQYLDNHNADSEIQYSIECEDRFGNSMEFSGEVDFGTLIKRSNSDEIWDTDPIEELSDDLSKIQRDIRKMRRSQRKEERASRWKNRIAQTKEIQKFVEEYGELTVSQIESLTNISENNVRYRLRALDSAGAVHYLENQDRAKARRDRLERTLDEF